jgi:hypothetical protein
MREPGKITAMKAEQENKQRKFNNVNTVVRGLGGLVGGTIGAAVGGDAGVFPGVFVGQHVANKAHEAVSGMQFK